MGGEGEEGQHWERYEWNESKIHLKQNENKCLFVFQSDKIRVDLFVRTYYTTTCNDTISFLYFTCARAHTLIQVSEKVVIEANYPLRSYVLYIQIGKDLHTRRKADNEQAKTAHVLRY